MPPIPTKTLNPLPFEHLEPKRFEDLVRQLVYDFRRWRQLEATGRSGSDDGFDARGWEAMNPGDLPLQDKEDGASADGEEVEQTPPSEDRLWLIQCKRERSIGPKKMLGHLEALPPETISSLYGLVFVAACDLSKDTRDACREWCRERGLQEVHVWGRGEIEDLLYQPKNDHLLFAYFNISLQIRKRSATSFLRRVTTVKRKLKRILGGTGWPGVPVVIRDPDDDRYPWADGKPLDSGFLWRPYAIKSLGPRGLRVIVRCFHAFYRHETQEWDVASGLNRAIPHEGEQLWNMGEQGLAATDQVILPWSRLPRGNQSFLYVMRDLPYDDIIEIDDIGDDHCELPTIFSSFRNGEPPFAESGQAYMEMSERAQQVHFEHQRRVRLFADSARDPGWEQRWTEGTGCTLPTSRYDLQLSDGSIWQPEEPHKTTTTEPT